LGVTEAGDGEDGRIKSAIGIGTLLEDGIGDTIRVSLTEDPEFEIPVCKDLVNRYQTQNKIESEDEPIKLTYDPFNYKRRNTFQVGNIGSNQVPVVIADYHKSLTIIPTDLEAVGYVYDEKLDKWHIADAAADYIYCQAAPLFNLPGTLKVLLDASIWNNNTQKENCFPLWNVVYYLDETLLKSSVMNFVMIDCDSIPPQHLLDQIKSDTTAVICLSSMKKNAVQTIRLMFVQLMQQQINHDNQTSIHKRIYASLVYPEPGEEGNGGRPKRHSECMEGNSQGQ
jgi:(E)-4-hydroxy-3-methylbut-2-enyl-diphosphate synthase